MVTNLYLAGITPLYIASQNGHLDVVRFRLILEQVNKSRDTCVTTVYISAQNGHFEVVRLLLLQEQMSTTHKPTDEDFTPM